MLSESEALVAPREKQSATNFSARPLKMYEKSYKVSARCE